MTVDPAVVPGLLLLALELLALAAIGYVVARVALRQSDDRMALAQGLVIGPALWGLVASFTLHLLPGMVGTAAVWIVVLALTAGLASRTPKALRLPVRTVVGFAAATFALFWVALACRQLLTIADAPIHLALSATIRAGTYPPESPWNPGLPVPYHYGVDLLFGLLAPPIGPDLAFVSELVGTYLWTGLALVIVTLLLKRGTWLGALILTPLVLTPGAWALIEYKQSPDILRVPVPVGMPMAGIRAAFSDIYWPTVGPPEVWARYFETPPPNIWTPLYVLSYALAFVAIERITANRSLSWSAALTLAALIGFLGLTEETVALTVLGLWGIQAALYLGYAKREQLISPSRTIRTVAGPALAALLLAFGGGVLTGVLTGAFQGSLSVGEFRSPIDRGLLGSFEPLLGNIGVLGLGALPVAAFALLLGWRQKLVVALTVGSGVFVLVALTLQHTTYEYDVSRLDGHARNLALVASLVALSGRLRDLRPALRYGAAGCLVALVVWPTIAMPVYKIRLALNHGIELANARPAPREFDESLEHMGRYVLHPFAPHDIIAYARDHTAVDARIFSPHPHALTIATGRPNASGFAGHLHLLPKTGPEYEDALRFLEPLAIRRLGLAYVHATDVWVAGLPDRAQRWLADPRLFTLLVRDGTDAIYRIEPAFLEFDMTPDPRSFESLRRTVPSSATVHVSPVTNSLTASRVAQALSHARLQGTEVRTPLYLLTDIPTEPRSEDSPDVVIVPRTLSFDASSHAFPAIWWNHAVVAYATRSPIAAAIAPPPVAEPGFSVRISEVQSTGERIRFTATFRDYAPDKWTGQDWLVIQVDDTPWAWPIRYEPDGFTLAGELWFPGQTVPSSSTKTNGYEFDARSGTLAVQRDNGSSVLLPTSGKGIKPGVWVLAVRLQLHYLQAALIPVLKIVISESGNVSYAVYEGERNASVNPCPEQMKYHDPCRKLAQDTKAAVSQ